MEKSWHIILFILARGTAPVEEFIVKQNPKLQAKIIRNIDLLEQFGQELIMPYSKKIKTDIYELRIRGVVQVRILYGFKGRDIILLHALAKKSARLSRKDIVLAEDRLASI